MTQQGNNFLHITLSENILIDGIKQFRYLLATQFAGKEARSAFVCYDEPQYKATIKLTLSHEKSHTAISNTDGSRFNE